MRRSILIAAVLTGGVLCAADITGGVMTGLSIPVGDLSDKSNFGTNSEFGVHVGGHLDFNLTSHHQVRGHLTFNSFPGSRWGGGFKNDFRDWSLGADWVYNFQNPTSGWYTVAGASLNSMHDDYDAPGVSGTASQSGRLGIRGGGGYNFTPNFSLEGTLNQVSVDKHGSDGFGFDSASWLQISAVFRFPLK